MTKTQAIEYALSHDDDDQLEDTDLLAAYRALYGHTPDDDDDWTWMSLWTFLHAHPDVSAAVEAAEQVA